MREGEGNWDCEEEIEKMKIYLLTAPGSTRRPRPICTDCISQRLAPLSRRCYSLQTTSASNATPAPPTSYLPTHPPLPNVSTSTSTGAPPYIPKAGILLSRAPLLTAPQTRFEKAFFFYQKRLNERLALPYQPYFYFKRGTPADTDRKIKMRERGGAAARELGAYKAYGPEAWHDELLSAEVEAGVGVEDVSVGKMGLAEPKWIVESLLRDARVRAVEGKDGEAVEVELDAGAEGGGREEQLGAGEVRIERPLSRKTESDRVGDKRRLDRELTRTLYLLVQMASGRWGFPVGGLEGRENLHQVGFLLLVFLLCPFLSCLFASLLISGIGVLENVSHHGL